VIRLKILLKHIPIPDIALCHAKIGLRASVQYGLQESVISHAYRRITAFWVYKYVIGVQNIADIYTVRIGILVHNEDVVYMYDCARM
jgi:hypothetical protein